MTVIHQAPRHRSNAKPITPLSDFAASFQSSAVGKRSVSAASATGLVLTAAVSVTAASADTVPTAPSTLPNAPSNDFVENLESANTATLVSLDVAWDPGDTVKARAVEPPAPEPEPEPEPEASPAAEATPARGATVAPESTSESDYVAPAAPASTAGGVVGTGYQYIGTPYVYGGTTPAGFDCSGFTSYVYGQNGISLPRTSYAQAGAGRGVSLGEAQPGDLIVASGGGHVGIYIGNGQMLHSPRPGKSVEVTSVSYFNVMTVRRF